MLLLVLFIGLPLLAGGGYLIYHLTRPTNRSGDEAKLEKFKKTLTGKWEGLTDGGDRAVIEFHADGTSRATVVVKGQPIEGHGRWEAVRLEGDRVIVRSAVEGTSIELPYWFVSDDEYQYVSPRGKTVSLRRIK